MAFLKLFLNSKRRTVRRVFFARIIFSVLMLCAADSVRAQTSAEFNLKAVYLFNFIQYVDWPTNAFADEKSPLIVGVLGRNPFGTALDDTVKGEVLKGRKLQVRYFRNVREIQSCHVLYISASEAENLKTILAGLKGKSILTVSDMEGFTSNGGMIRFIKTDNKIGFRINVDAAKAAGLSISSKLLQLADVARADPGP